MYTTKSRKRVIGVFVTSALASTTLIGGVYAGLSANVAQEGKDTVVSSFAVGGKWVTPEGSAGDGLINANISPTANPTPQVFTKYFQNNTTIKARGVYHVTGLSVTKMENGVPVAVNAVPDSLLDQTKVEVTFGVDDDPAAPGIQSGRAGKVDTITLREFLTNGLYFGDEGNLVPRTVSTMEIRITAPNGEADGSLYTDAIGDYNISFTSNMGILQLIGGKTDLTTYVKGNPGVKEVGWGAGDIWLIPNATLQEVLAKK